MKSGILLLCFLSTCLAATCPQCPVNGIWSEWTHNGVCATTCGACSNITKTRTCISTSMGCNCVGSATVTAPCNTQACNMPRSNAKDLNCCQGTPMIISNWYHCGPVEVDYKLDCCPDGGYWGSWSGFSKIPGKIGWKRSRTCASGSYGCPCTGESTDTVYSCPCKPIKLMTATDNPCASTDVIEDYQPFTVRGLVQRPSMCETELVLEATNFRGEFLGSFAGDNSNYNLATLVASTSEAGSCFVQYYHVVLNATSVKDTGVSVKRIFDCDLDTLLYKGNGLTKIEKIAQFYRNPTNRG